jgi:hypothetical protein
VVKKKLRIFNLSYLRRHVPRTHLLAFSPASGGQGDGFYKKSPPLAAGGIDKKVYEMLLFLHEEI